MFTPLRFQLWCCPIRKMQTLYVSIMSFSHLQNTNHECSNYVVLVFAKYKPWIFQLCHCLVCRMQTMNVSNMSLSRLQNANHKCFKYVVILFIKCKSWTFSLQLFFQVILCILTLNTQLCTHLYVSLHDWMLFYL